MDATLAELIARLRAHAPNEQGEVAPAEDAGEALSDDELQTLADEVSAIVADVDLQNPSAEDLETLSDCRQVHDEVAAEQGRRSESLAERRAEAARLAQGIVQPAADEVAAEAAPAEAEAEAAPAEQAEAAPDATQAAATPLPSMAALARRAASRAANRPAPRQVDAAPAARLVAAADMPALPTGEAVDIQRWARSAARKIESVRNLTRPHKDGSVENLPLGTIMYADQYREADRWLDQDDAANARKIDAVTSPQAIAAAGGICGPLAVDYAVPQIGTAERPVRDGMAQFGGDRGGLRFVRPFTLSAVSALTPSQVWTATTDANPGGSTKGHATFVCQTPVDETVDAVTSIVQFGNFQARFMSEETDQFLQQVDVNHARLAEATLLAKMVTDATAAPTSGTDASGQTGAASEYFAELDRILARLEYRHRLADGTPFRVWIGRYFRRALQADIARELPGGTIDERLRIASAQIDGWFASRGVNVSWFMDSPTSFATVQGWGVVQGNGPALPWPDKVLTIVSHEGAWTFIDGGELNLGMVRDSTLNATNDFQMFSETFEKAAFRGFFSEAWTMDFCPNGARAATVDTAALCVSGS